MTPDVEFTVKNLFNYDDSSLHAKENFKKLNGFYKCLTIIATAMGSIVPFFGNLAAYRFFSVILPKKAEGETAHTADTVGRRVITDQAQPSTTEKGRKPVVDTDKLSAPPSPPSLYEVTSPPQGAIPPGTTSSRPSEDAPPASKELPPTEEGDKPSPAALLAASQTSKPAMTEAQAAQLRTTPSVYGGIPLPTVDKGKYVGEAQKRYDLQKPGQYYVNYCQYATSATYNAENKKFEIELGLGTQKISDIYDERLDLPQETMVT